MDGVDADMTKLGGAALTWLVPLALLAGWQFASATGALPARILPAPLAVVSAAAELSASGVLWEN